MKVNNKEPRGRIFLLLPEDLILHYVTAVLPSITLLKSVESHWHKTGIIQWGINSLSEESVAGADGSQGRML